MLKNLCQLECVVDNISIKLLCDNNTPITSLKEALFQFQKYVGSVEDAAKAQQENKIESKEDKQDV